MENCSTVNESMEDLSSNVDLYIDLDCDLDQRSGTSVELIEAAGEASKDLLPSKSKDRYQKEYDNFQKWKSTKAAMSNSERVVIPYFTEMGKKNSPSTLWARYSMLKATMKIYDNVDISTYPSLSAMLKKKSHWQRMWYSMARCEGNLTFVICLL